MGTLSPDVLVCVTPCTNHRVSVGTLSPDVLVCVTPCTNHRVKWKQTSGGIQMHGVGVSGTKIESGPWYVIEVRSNPIMV